MVPIMKTYKYVYLCVVIVSVIIVFLFAPVNHPNLQLNDEEVRICKKSARRLIVGISIGAIILIKLNMISECVYYMIAGMGINTGLLLLAKILKQEVRE